MIIYLIVGNEKPDHTIGLITIAAGSFIIFVAPHYQYIELLVIIFKEKQIIKILKLPMILNQQMKKYYDIEIEHIY
jgi:hypothetical protein